jgi:uncharacterized RDD family membrane protein YckC
MSRKGKVLKATIDSNNDPMSLPSAGVWRRLAAMLYDAFLILALWMGVGAVAIAVNGGEAIASNNPVLPSLLLIATVGFYTYFWRRGGQTLGMRAWRLRLVNERSGPVTGLQCALRCIVGIGSLCGFLGYIWLWFDAQNKTWHDRVSFTKVVVVPKQQAKAVFH